MVPGPGPGALLVLTIHVFRLGLDKEPLYNLPRRRKPVLAYYKKSS